MPLVLQGGALRPLLGVHGEGRSEWVKGYEQDIFSRAPCKSLDHIQVKPGRVVKLLFL